MKRFSVGEYVVPIQNAEWNPVTEEYVVGCVLSLSIDRKRVMVQFPTYRWSYAHEELRSAADSPVNVALDVVGREFARQHVAPRS